MTRGQTQTSDESDHGLVILEAGGAMIVMRGRHGSRLSVLYAGPALPSVRAEELEQLSHRQHAPGGPEEPVDASWLNAVGTGHPSPPGLLAHSDGEHWALDPRVVQATVTAKRSATIVTRDAASGLRFDHSVQIDPASGVASFATSVINDGARRVALDWCAAVCLPIDERIRRVASFTGKWANEFQIEQHDLARGSFVRESRAGRTSHDCFPGLYLGTPTTGEDHGPACALHLAWSGNSRLRADSLPDGSVSVQAGELLLPGEIMLEPGQEYSSPTVNACWSDTGYGEITRRLHRFVSAISPQPAGPRPVHYNTWEAVYFDHSPEKLLALADHAASVGAERFVLDDGWFGARRNDRAGLGDWFVSADVYPGGLGPLADHVRSLGMEFGLWFEPEMVNPDSDLYRAHPDWILQADGLEPIPSRHQLPLDLTRREVRDYLFERIDSLVSELGIGYIKWDMNRDIQHPGGADGRPAMHRQVCALFDLIDRLRSAHPKLQIESCSSGGARADYGILARTHRVWTSDNNDARQRYAIMRGAAQFLPLSVLGNHVGPKRCHITGRRFDMAFRAGTAVFGHMGMELDLASETETDRAVLAKAIALHKRYRALIHAGAYHRLAVPDHLSGMGTVSGNRSEALFQIAVLDQHPATHPPKIRFAGLDPARRYRLTCVWPESLRTEPASFAGSALMDFGMQLPQTFPDTCLIYHLESDA
uniref:alpha-galactosidase n=1 Tax=Parerythrobacter lutipelagi TaxID=1964208 RepID=UPI0010F70CCA|nr:alpha-galactosidase [Parerythrobacter lutipelagi]